MNRAFKVIQGHPYWCRQESRTVCCRNVQLMPTSFLKLTKIWQRENGKFVDFNSRPHDRSLRRFDTVPACDGQTDGQMDGFTVASTSSYADAL